MTENANSDDRESKNDFMEHDGSEENNEDSKCLFESKYSCLISLFHAKHHCGNYVRYNLVEKASW